MGKGAVTPPMTPKKLAMSAKTYAASQIGAAVGRQLAKQIKQMGNGGFSTQKAATSMDIDSKENIGGTTYVQRKKSKKATRKKVKKLIRKKKFEGKVLQAINSGQLGTKVISFTDAWSNSAIAINQQANIDFCFYGNHPLTFSQGRGFRDLYRIVNQDTMGTGPGSKIQITSMYATMTLFNNGANQFFIDIYEVTNKKNETEPDGFSGVWAKSITEGGTQAGAGSVTNTDLFSTPFSSPLFMQKFSVVSKTSVALGTNETYKWEVKKAIPFNYDFDKSNEHQYLRPTFGYIFVIYGRPFNDGGTPRLAAAKNANALLITSTRTYFYKRTVQGVNGPTDTAAGQQTS